MINFTRLKHFIASRGLAALSALLLCNTAGAQEYRLLNNVQDAEGNIYALNAMTISPNHRYIAGIASSFTDGIQGLFVYDLETNAIALEQGVGEIGGDLRGVNDNGMAVGFNPNALVFGIDGTRTELFTPANCESGARDLTDDGKTVVGSYWSINDYIPHPCVWIDGEITYLEEPTQEEMGFEVNGSQASFISGDGSIIMGYVHDPLITFPVIFWRLQDDGSYKLDIACKEFFGRYTEEAGKPYTMFRANNISHNGKYAALTVSQDYSETRMARFDTETGEIVEFVADGTGNFTSGAGTGSLSITDDGSIAGFTYTATGRAACLWRAGTHEPDILSLKYPQFTDLAVYEDIGYNVLYDITPDGKVGLGNAYDENVNLVSYLIEFEDTATGVEKVDTEAVGDAEVARYTVGGTRISAPVKGINIVRNADGKVSKILVK